MVLRFTKMHGLGNDYIFIDACAQQEVLECDLSDLARRLSDRHRGVGGDGLILVCTSPTDEADVGMRMFNADGSEAEMCGNGIRCLAKFVLDHGLTPSNPLRVATAGGVLQISCERGSDGLVSTATVNMGVPNLELDRIPVDVALLLRLDGQGTAVVGDGEQEWTARFVSMGNPHMVVFLDRIEAVNELSLESVGPRLERAEAFPQRMNVHFAHALSRNEATMRTWERGSGITLACGTGASAVVVAGVLEGRLERDVLVHLPGGDLHIAWPGPHKPVHMTGPATEVFSGEFDPS